MVAFSQGVGLDMDVILSDSTIFRNKRKATADIRDSKLEDMKQESNAFVLQFDMKDTKEAVVISALAKYATVKTCPLKSWISTVILQVSIIFLYFY